MPLPLAVVLDRALPAPLGVQLADQVRALIVTGVLPAGERLPSTRALAADLGTSRTVTDQGYEQLLAEGWVETRRGAGTFVASVRHHGTHVHAPVPCPSPAVAPAPVAAPLVRLDTGTPWTDPRLGPGWRRAWRATSAATPPRGYPDHRGLPALREALAAHLARTRGLVVDADDVRVTHGTVDGLRLLLQVLPDGAVGVEDPGYRAAVTVAHGARRTVRPLPAAGRVTDLAGCAAAYVTPAHQHPLGRVMPAADRVALLDEAHRTGCLVVEDDYDSELRYDVAPVPALAALDRDQVAYLGTASKSVSPGLRLGWLVAPERWTRLVDEQRRVTHDTPAWAVQHAFTTLLGEGHVDRAVRSARRVYAARAPRVVAALEPYARLAGPAAGMYTTWLLDAARARTVRDRVRERGFEVNLLTDYCRESDLAGLVVGFGGVDDDELDGALRALVDALRADV